MSDLVFLFKDCGSRSNISNNVQLILLITHNSQLTGIKCGVTKYISDNPPIYILFVDQRLKPIQKSYKSLSGGLIDFGLRPTNRHILYGITYQELTPVARYIGNPSINTRWVPF